MTTSRRPRSRVLSILLILSLAVVALGLVSGRGSATAGSKPPVTSADGTPTVVDQLSDRFKIWGKQFTQWLAQLKFGGDIEAHPGEDAVDRVAAWAQTAWGQVREAAKTLWISLQAQFRRMFAGIGGQEVELAI